MSKEVKTYRIEDMEELDYDLAPSLDIPSLHVDHVLMPKDGAKYMLFQATVKKDYHLGIKCSDCGKTGCLTRSGKGEKRLVHDLTRNNYRVDIVILTQRYKCNKCDNRITAPIEGIIEGRQMTERLYEYLNRKEKKETVIEKLKRFFERFWNIG